jgi:hypothetical protein
MALCALAEYIVIISIKQPKINISANLGRWLNDDQWLFFDFFMVFHLLDWFLDTNGVHDGWFPGFEQAFVLEQEINGEEQAAERSNEQDSEDVALPCEQVKQYAYG